LSFCSSGHNEGIFKCEEEAKKAMLKTIKTGINVKVCLYSSYKLSENNMTYYVITETETEWNDLFYADSDPPEYNVEDMYIIKNGEFVKLVDEEDMYKRYTKDIQR
jgi:hypothetical protein